jgi:predicted transcriptional regulator
LNYRLTYGITFSITMKTVTLKIPDGLDRKIRQAITRRKERFSDLARRALTREIEEQEVDFARLAAPYRGMFKGDSDLSSREGYGNRDHR